MSGKHTSRLNNTPPIGDPNATLIPADAAADSTSLLRASLLLKVPKAFKNTLAQQHATCTKGPSLPNHSPDATARHYSNQDMQNQQTQEHTSPSDLMTKVHPPRRRRITNPPNIVLISGIPLCCAYIAYFQTSTEADTAKATDRITNTKYSINQLPAIENILKTALQGLQSLHSAKALIHQPLIVKETTITYSLHPNSRMID